MQNPIKARVAVAVAAAAVAVAVANCNARLHSAWVVHGFVRDACAAQTVFVGHGTQI